MATATPVLGKPPVIDPATVTAAQQAAASAMAGQNASLFPTISGMALSSSLSASNDINKQLASQFYGNLSELGVDYKGALSASGSAMTKVKSMADELMTGQLPSDVKQSIMQSRAELGLSHGLFGEAAQAATARDIGKTSLDMMTMGAQQEGQVSTLVSNLLQQAKSVMAPTMTPAEVAQLFQGNQGILAKGMFGDVGTAQAGAADAISKNAAMDWEYTISQFTAEREDQARAEDLAMMRKSGGGGVARSSSVSPAGGSGYNPYTAPSTPAQDKNVASSGYPEGTTFSVAEDPWSVMTQEDADYWSGANDVYDLNASAGDGMEA